MARVLIVDADPRVRATLRSVLERRRHEVHEAASGRDGVAAAKRLAIHLIFADVQTGEAQGADLITELRTVTAAPIVAMSHGQSARSIAPLAAALNLGANGFLLKPFTIDDVISALQGALPPGGFRNVGRGIRRDEVTRFIGGLNVPTRIHVEFVEAIRYYSRQDAQTRWGLPVHRGRMVGRSGSPRDQPRPPYGSPGAQGHASPGDARRTGREHGHAR